MVFAAGSSCFCYLCEECAAMHCYLCEECAAMHCQALGLSKATSSVAADAGAVCGTTECWECHMFKRFRDARTKVFLSDEILRAIQVSSQLHCGAH